MQSRGPKITCKGRGLLQLIFGALQLHSFIEFIKKEFPSNMKNEIPEIKVISDSSSLQEDAVQQPSANKTIHIKLKPLFGDNNKEKSFSTGKLHYVGWYDK